MEAKGRKVSWKADFSKLDFQYYLPMFFEVLCETENSYELFAQQGMVVKQFSLAYLLNLVKQNKLINVTKYQGKRH